ncbi:MAG: cytochrome c3 family protein [Bacteroidota bacterium]
MKYLTLLTTSIICLFSSYVYGQLGEIDLATTSALQNSPEEIVLNACTDCHSDLVGQKVMHYPAEDDCENCHMANGEEHPQEGVKGFDMADEMPGLCFLCHEENTKTNIHAPSEMGECLMCHSAHGSPNKGLLVKSKESELCADCHDMSMTEQRVKHGPVAGGDCSSCHEPHQSDNYGLLKTEKRSMCLNCHTSVRMESELENIHYPFEDDCANCHETHSSEHDGLLVDKSRDLCLTCHDMQSTLDEAKVVHGVVNDEKGCANCHSPHASKNGMLLLKSGKALCLDCHSEPIETEERVIADIGSLVKPGNYVHGVIEMDGCGTCHFPHSSEQPFLLNSAFPGGAYAAATVENFDLCFMCHDAELMESETTSYATNFRNGEQNLHYLHINGEKGRNCNLCHNVHGSGNEHLMADKVLFGSWEMPVGFTPLESGGSCLTGCHAEKKYLRSP